MGTQKQTVGPMTGKERVLAALKREPVDQNTDLQPNVCRHSRIDGLGGRTVPGSEPAT